MEREEKQEDHLLQLPEAGSYGCRLPIDQKQIINLQEALQKEDSQSYFVLEE